MDSPKAQNSTTLVPDNKKDQPLEGGHSTKIGGMWTLKHEISSPKLYEIPIKIELKGNISMDLKTLYKHINVSFNAVIRL